MMAASGTIPRHRIAVRISDAEGSADLTLTSHEVGAIDPLTTARVQFITVRFLHRRVAFLPFVSLCLKTERPWPYPRIPATLGEHLRKQRIEAGLYQRQVAAELGVTLHTIIDWEKDRKAPEARHWPKIITFLGFDPYPEPKTLGERLRARYRELGLSRREASRRLGMDENTLEAYETGKWQPTKDRTRRLIERFLSAS